MLKVRKTDDVIFYGLRFQGTVCAYMKVQVRGQVDCHWKCHTLKI